MQRRKRYLVVAAIVAALAAAAAVAIPASRSSTAHAVPAPVVEQVPSTIPEGGVTMLRGVADVTLMPQGQDASFMSAEDAIAHAPKVDASTAPAAVLTNVTIGSTIPLEGESPEGYKTIQNRPAWVITYTYAEPMDVRIVKYTGKVDPSPAPLMMSHFNQIIDAKSGDFLLGFFTK